MAGLSVGEQRVLKPDGCRCRDEHTNIYCFITTPPTESIGDLLKQLGFTRDDNGVRAALEELRDLRDERESS